MIEFKARAFRLNRSDQYADQLWTRTLSTIAEPSSGGTTDALKAAYLPSGDLAVPTVFGVLSWTSPSSLGSAQCRIRLFDSATNAVTTAASFTSTRAEFAGLVATPQGLEIDGTWRIHVDAATGSLVFQWRNPSGVFETKHAITYSSA
jgi:hypothetical protein